MLASGVTEPLQSLLSFRESPDQYRAYQHLDMFSSSEKILLDHLQLLSFSLFSFVDKTLKRVAYHNFHSVFASHLCIQLQSDCCLFQSPTPLTLVSPGSQTLPLSTGPEAATLTDTPISAEHWGWLSPSLTLEPGVNGHSYCTYIAV